MIIYFYLFIPLLFATTTDSSSIRGRNNENDLVPFTNSRSEPEMKDSSVKTVGSEPLFVQLLPDSGKMEDGGKDKKKKRQEKKRVSKIKALRKRQRTRRELQVSMPKSSEEEFSEPLETPNPGLSAPKINPTEKLPNLTNAIKRVDALKALSTYSKEVDNKRSHTEALSFTEDRKNDHEIGKHAALNRNPLKHILAEQRPLVKMVYPNAPKLDRHSHKYTYRDLISDRERLEQKINYIKNMLSLNESIIDDAIRVRRRSDSDRVANKMAKMFLTLSAVNGLHDRRKSKCEKDDDDDDDDDNRIWEKERKGIPSRKRSSSNAERYKVKKWIEFMKNKRSYGKTCPCMASYGEERDVFPLEQKMPKDYFTMERRGSSEESAETYKDPMYTSRDKLNRESNSRRRLNKSQEDQESKLKEPSKTGKKKQDSAFTDLEIYRSRAKQILRNAEEILDRIKEEEEKRLTAPNTFMNQLRELTSRIQGDPRNNENELIRKLQKNLGWGALARPQEGSDGNQFTENVKSFVADPYEKAKALTDESAKKLSSYLLWNLGKIQASGEQTEGREVEGDGKNLRVYFGRVPPKENESPLPDNLERAEPEADPTEIEKSDAHKEETYKQRIEGIIKEQQKILDSYKVDQNSEDSRKETERVGDMETETVREPQTSNREGNVELQLKEHDTDRNTEPREKTIKSSDISEKVRPDSVENKPLPHPEGTTRRQKGGIKGAASRNMRPKENVQEKLEEFTMTINRDNIDMTGDEEKERSDQAEDSMVQPGEELMQTKHDREGADEEEEVQVIASPQKTPGDISERDENDVASSPYLTNDYDFISAKESKNGPSEPEEENPTDLRAVGDYPIQTKLNDGEVIETKANLETEKSRAETRLNPLKDVSILGSKERLGSQESALENSMERKEPYVEEKQEANKVDGPKQHPEYVDLVKEIIQASKERSKTDIAPDEFLDKEMKDRNEELKEAGETLEMVHSDDGKDQLTPERTDRANKDGQTLLKLASDLQDSEVFEENDDQDDPNGTLLKENLHENSEEYETEKELKPAYDNQDRQNIEFNDYTSLKAENPETSKEKSSEETLLEEALKKMVGAEGEEVPLRAVKPIEETDGRELVKSADEGNSDRLLLKEAEENLAEVPLLEAVNHDQESDAAEESFEENNNSNEKNKADEEDSEGAHLKALRDEGLEEDTETLTVGSSNKEDGRDSENLQEANVKTSAENEEETLKSEHVADDESYQGNQEEREISREIIGKEMPEEGEKRSEENAKSEEYIGHENDNGKISESLNKYQKNLEEESFLKIGEPKESSNELEENDHADNEATLRAENSNVEAEDVNEETSREVQTSRSQENFEDRNDKIVLEQENPEGEAEEEQNSYETLKAALENETQDIAENVEDDERIKAANPGDDNQKLKEQYSNEVGGDENVKAVFEDNEEQDGNGEIVKARVENAEDTRNDEEELKAANFLRDVQEERNSNEEDNDESVKAAFEKESQENLNENDENLKSVKSQENLESDDTVREALENPENVEENEETLLKEARADEELKPNEYVEERADNENVKLRESEATETEDEDDAPLRASFREENMEEEDETLQAENLNGQHQKESNNESQLRSVSREDELDNKIDDENPLRFSNPMVETGDQDYSSLNEDNLREESSDNQVHDRAETLKLENFDVHQSAKSSNEDSNEIFTDDVSGENAEEDNDPTVKGVNLRAEAPESRSQLSDLVQVSESSSKPLKGSALKVPKSIAQIMNDLEGKTKDDIVSLQKLNPDKIDHIIGKIDQAEQKNLLESQETDCMKECACAEEMNTRSRNIGRYEIVKDFLHWMKDLQLNRVLSDD